VTLGGLQPGPPIATYPVEMNSKAPLLANVPAPVRWTLGMGLLGLCVWLPALVALFT
jgi:hypothetical protein